MSTQFSPGTGFAVGAADASCGAVPVSPGDSTTSAAPPAATAEHDGSLWYVPGIGDPVEAFVV